MSSRPEVVVVTGASAGIGRATARRFGARGAGIGLIGRDRDRLETTAREVEAAGGRALAVSTDVADADALEQAADRIEQTLGPIDVWINNAMATVFAPLERITPAEFRRATEVTYLGAVWGTMAALRRMAPRNRGTIVQVGSALAYRAIPLQAAYCGAKHAIRGFTESVRTELIHEGIDVHLTMVQLPAHNTPQFDWACSKLPRQPQPVPPIYQPELAAEAIEYAALHRRRELYVAWPTVRAILGDKLAPGLLDRLARTAWDDQQLDERVSPERPSNLFEPAGGDPGARGRFDDRAKSRSIAWWISAHRASLAGAAALAATAAGAAVVRRA